MRERALQLALGGEFSFSGIGKWEKKALLAVSNMELFTPLVIFAPYQSDKDVVAKLNVCGNGKEIKATLFFSPESLIGYLRENRVCGLICLFEDLDILSLDFSKLLQIFTHKGKVESPGKYRVWVVDKSLSSVPVSPKEEYLRDLIERRKKLLRETGLVGINYRHNKELEIGYFEARFPKKREVKEKDLTDDPRVRFLKMWAEKIAEYKRARVLDDSRLRQNIERSKFYLKTIEEVSDLDGVVLEYLCGCRVSLKKGTEEILVSCREENCEMNKKGERASLIFLGREIGISACGDCGGKRVAVPYWYDIDTYTLSYEVKCSGYSSHGYRGKKKVAPERISNPLYIFYSLQKKKKK